ncbi:glycoside hydrolase family 1 protein [Candidatus Parcubacteria bacterium]|nr:MAG: glycoside hydrolase family 1 protein [Candidatus Parcubacteria bacterium]
MGLSTPALEALCGNKPPKSYNKTVHSSFLKGFFFGAATSAHQVEGGNRNDWTEWEVGNADRLAAEAKKRSWPEFLLKNDPSPLQKENYISGKACDHYNRFEEDFDIAKKLGHNAHRFSIEWSRVEPLEGRFNEKELEHYRNVVHALRKRNLEPFVTLWHWTIPLWLKNKGGLESSEFQIYFSRYAEKVVGALGTDITFWITLNEPNALVRRAYIEGDWPPCKRSFLSAFRVLLYLARAHRAAYQIIHKHIPRAQVGWSSAVRYFKPARKNVLDYLSTMTARFWSEKFFLLLTRNENDYLAIQYYRKGEVQFPLRITDTGDLSDIGWAIHPEGLHFILKRLSRYKKPIYITENGLADARDAQRGEFIRNHLAWMKKAMDEGADVRGYFHWSLLDNFEWSSGFWPRFGLVEVNYKTFKRKIRPSALVYKSIIEKDLSSS